MFMEAYTMAAQAQQFFPLSSLFRILNLDGKDKILPVIEANENYQQQMQQMQAQMEQMGQQMEQMAEENQNLKKIATQTTNALAAAGARTGGALGGKVAEAGGGPNTANAVVNQARNQMGQQMPV
jgi:TolA-binding protein